MGLLDYFEDEQPLFGGGVLRDGYDLSPQGRRGNDVVPQDLPSAPIETPAVGPAGRPRVIISGNRCL